MFACGYDSSKDYVFGIDWSTRIVHVNILLWENMLRALMDRTLDHFVRKTYPASRVLATSLSVLVRMLEEQTTEYLLKTRMFINLKSFALS